VTDDEYTKLAFTKNQNGNRFLEFQTETGGSRTWHGQTNVAGDFPSTIHLRLVSDGSAITVAYSADGQAWTALAGSAPVKEGATFGVMAGGDTAAADTVAKVDYVHVTGAGTDDGEREPSDEFEGDALDGCRWDAIVRYDGSKVAVADGELRITTQPGDINAGNNGDPRNFVLQTAPEGDWVVETRFKAPLAHRWQLAGLIAYGDDDNYVKADVLAKNTPGTALNLGAELVSEKGGQFGNGGNRQLELADSTESGYWYVRLEKVGSTYQGWVSDGGVSWTPLGDPVTNDAALTKVGLMAIGPEQETPVTVAFDWFRLTTESEPEPTVDVEVTASARCLAGKAYLALRATNADEAPVAITLTTPFGSKEFGAVEVGANAYQSFASRATSFEAGTATVTATLGDVTTEIEVPYDAVSCG
jgi:regulation of enolase protein 1 (concanavalin A-like superfamily)